MLWGVGQFAILFYGCVRAVEAAFVGVERLSRWFGRLRWGLLALAAAVCLAAFCVVALPGKVEVARGSVAVVAFPKPALNSQPWDARVAAFGLRLHGAFAVPVAEAEEFAGWILEAADRQNLTPELIAGLVFTESSFRKFARSQAGAIGPAQVKPHYWREFCGADDLLDPEQNIHCGAQILAYLEDRCGGLECALSLYNIGVNSQRKQAGLRYVSKVGRHRARLDRL